MSGFVCNYWCPIIFNELCGIAADDGAGGDVLGDNGSCGHDGILADSHARQDDGAYANPGIAADVDGLATEHHAVLEVVVVSDDAHVGADHHTVVDGDAASSHAGQRVIHKHTATDFHLAGEVYLERRHQVARLVEIPVEELLLQRTNLLRCRSAGVDLKTDVGEVGHVLDGLCILGGRHIDVSP